MPTSTPDGDASRRRADAVKLAREALGDDGLAPESYIELADYLLNGPLVADRRTGDDDHFAQAAKMRDMLDEANRVCGELRSELEHVQRQRDDIAAERDGLRRAVCTKANEAVKARRERDTYRRALLDALDRDAGYTWPKPPQPFTRGGLVGGGYWAGADTTTTNAEQTPP